MSGVNTFGRKKCPGERSGGDCPTFATGDPFDPDYNGFALEDVSELCLYGAHANAIQTRGKQSDSNRGAPLKTED